MGVRIVRSKAILAAFGVALGAALSLLPAAAQAQQPQGITVAPAEVSLTLAKGATSAEGAIGIRNNTRASVRLSAVVHGMQQTGSGMLVPSDDAEPALAKALKVDNPEFTLEPDKSINVKLTLTDSREIAPGGHYVSLLIREVRSSGNNLALSQAVSARVFIVKEEGAVRGVTVDGVTDDGGIFRVPHMVTVSFGNSGNVAIVPRASVAVHDMRGRLVASGVLNTESVTVLPSKQAHLQTRLTPIARVWIPGTYKLQITYRYDGSDQQQTGETTMTIIPPLFLALLAVGGLLIAAVAWLVWRFWPRRKGSYGLKKLPTPQPAAPQPQKPQTHRPAGHQPVTRSIRRRIDF